MSEQFVSRGFTGKRRPAAGRENRLPPGQYLTESFPVLSAGPTPRIPLSDWKFSLSGLVHPQKVWTWDEFIKLPARDWTVDISCVTKWTQLDMHWRGVSLDTLFEHAELAPNAAFATAFCYGGYTTNLPVADLLNGQAFIAYEYEGKPLAPEHGGPARMVVPHLYFWKSPKWINGLNLMENDRPGFWERVGYHDRGDPWKEQRYQGD